MHPSARKLLSQFIRNNMILNKNFWKYIIIYGATFYSSYNLFDKLLYPKLHKKAIAIATMYVSCHQSMDESIMKSNKHCKSIREIADHSSRIVSFLHALLGCIAAIYFWNKYKRTTDDLIHPVSIKYRNDELSSLDITCAYFVFDLWVLLRYDRDIGFICHHLAALSLCAALYTSRHGSAGHQWLVFTAECPTLILNVVVFCEDTLKYIKYICDEYKLDWNIIIDNNTFLKKLKTIYRFYLILFAIMFIYFRCYEWSKRTPRILINCYKDADKLGIHPFAKWNWLISSGISYILSMIWSVVVFKKGYKFGIMGQNGIWD